MLLHRPAYSTRSLTLVLLAAFAGVALWLAAPWGGGVGSGSGSDASAALPPSLRVDGLVQVQSSDNVVTRLLVPLTVRGNGSVLLTDDSGTMRVQTAMSDTASASVPAEFSVAWLDGNGDRYLNPGEHVMLTVDLPSRSSVHPGNPLQLVLYPAGGGSLIIDDVLP